MPSLPVPGLTICQPWASLIAWGDKRVENRTWRESYRGPLLIHAGKSRLFLDRYGDVSDVPGPRPLPMGAIVATAWLTACVRAPVARHHAWALTHPYADAGKVWWLLERVRPLERPLPWRGAQGLWNASDACRALGLPATFDPEDFDPAAWPEEIEEGSARRG